MDANIFLKLTLREHTIIYIPVAPEGQYKTTITAPFGMFDFYRMTFGLRNAGQTSRINEKHFEYLYEIFSRFSKYGITLRLLKCLFGV